MRRIGIGYRLVVKSNGRRFFKKDKDAVASTIGTIMALLIFLTFLSMFVNTYVPTWMKENERTHMNEVMNEFGDMKGKVDNMIVYTSLTNLPSFPAYQNIQLGANGVPAFASPTAGFLFINPKGYNQSMMSTQFLVSGQTTLTNISGGGRIEFYGPNRYYVQQWIAYENGGIILKQEDGQIVRASPSILLTNDTGTINLQITQMDILGQNSSNGGTGIVGLNLALLYVNTQTYSLSSSMPKITMCFDTQFGPAYYKYFNDTLASLGLSNNGKSWNTTTTMTQYWQKTGTDSGYEVTLVKLYNNMYRVEVQITNPIVKPGSLTFSEAYLEVEVSG